MLSIVYDLLDFKHAFLWLKGIVLIDSLSKTVTTVYKSSRLLLILLNCSLKVSRNLPKIFNCHWIWLFLPSLLLDFIFILRLLFWMDHSLEYTWLFFFIMKHPSVSILKTILSDLKTAHQMFLQWIFMGTSYCNLFLQVIHIFTFKGRACLYAFI